MLGETMVRRQGRVPRSHDGQTPHTALQGGGDLAQVVAEEQPACGVDVRVLGLDGPVARHVGLGPRIDSVEPVGDQRPHV